VKRNVMNGWIMQELAKNIVILKYPDEKKVKS
jgi:hypothetical protein